MRGRNLDQTAILQNFPPKIPLNPPNPSRDRLLRESSPFPFQTNQYLKDKNKTEEYKQAPGRPLISVSNKNQKRVIIKPDGSKINMLKINRNPKGQPKRIQAPFATETPIYSARRVINKKPRIANEKEKANLNREKTGVKNLIQSENNETVSPRRFNNKKDQNINKNVFYEQNNELVIPPLPNQNVAVIQQTDFQNPNLPLIPSSRNRFKQSQFPKRIKQIDAIVKEHREILNKLINIVESKIPQKANESLIKINEFVEKPLNSLLSNTIQSYLSNFFEKNSMFEKIIGNSEQVMQNEYQQITDSLSEHKIMISQFANSMNAFESSHILNDSLNEVSRLNDKISFTVSDKLKAIENDEVLKSATAAHLKDNLELLKSSLTDEISSSITQTNNLIDNECQKISESIQSECAEKSKKIFDHLSSEIQNLSNSLNSAFTDFNETIDQTSESMKLSIEEFEKSLQEATDDIKDDREKVLSEMTEQLNTVLENSQKNFEIFRNETAKTVEEIIKKNTKENDEFMMKIENQYQAVKKNSIDVQKKFDNFISLVENERNLQICYFFDANRPSENPQNEQNQSVFKMDVNQMIRKEVAPEMALLSYSVECINSAESRLQHLESFLENTKTQFSSQYDSINNDLNEAAEKVENLKLLLNGDGNNTKSLSHIEKMIDKIEKKHKNPLNLAQNAELKALEQITQTAMEEKISIVSNKLNEINHQIDLIKLDMNQENELKSISDSDDKSKYNNGVGSSNSPKFFENSLVDNDDDYMNNYSDSYSDESAF